MITPGVRSGGRTSLPSESEIRAVLHEFVGEIEQRPPVYSAKHIGGQRAYRLARAGRKVTLPPVRVKVHALSLVGFEAGTARIACQVGPGTYIRALARDLGERLGGAAHLCALRRTAVGPFRVEAAGRLAELSDPAAARARLLGPLEALAGLPRHLVSRDQATALGHGRRLPLRCRDCRPGIGSGDGDAFRVAWTRAEGETRERLVAVIRATSDGWRPVVVWSRPRLCRS